mmetsp:Transcript_32254/g.55035  ORF Transcript_32254/g.55035 Transcript_32254/m.55035 type:complete len:246 (+) Transcript_32254:26-763(+)|eukprot:CAMPEP_0183762882 /NCGR_PEP_ID=MMETSP0739-20130205/9348_1 /TAXON_ID=385413 /ORGANISM="Thalassiosira miniscula, Strain CCMP1093" /LENGTH=245 /DNA_ID=CAMNT_0026001217 /DNA_START=11 /DNA_END=748 /DNA_ORIENTATION=-
MMASANPSFEPPNDDSDQEIWMLRAPAHLDVSKLLNGVTLDVNSRTSAASNSILSRFTSSDGSEYALTLGDPSESDHLRLLVPDSEGNELVPYGCPFQRNIHLTSAVAASNSGTGENTDVQAELILAPAKDAAPKPAFDQSGNGSVDTMRLAYVPVPQRQGLKRRWAMPGSKVEGSSTSTLYSTSKKARVGNDANAGGSVNETPMKISDDEDPKKVAKSSSKKEKKEKKKKEKKSEKKSKKSSKK